MSARQYELLYIVSPDATDQQVSEVHDEVQAIVTRLDGIIDKSDNWGRRKLAYEIKRHKDGIYVLETITGSAELMKELDRRLKVRDFVVRHLIVRIDERQKIAERMQAERAAEAERRRERRGLTGEEPRPARDDHDEEDSDQEEAEA
jgi:small subunit ribosomal protein S6